MAKTGKHVQVGRKFWTGSCIHCGLPVTKRKSYALGYNDKTAGVVLPRACNDEEACKARSGKE